MKKDIDKLSQEEIVSELAKLHKKQNKPKEVADDIIEVLKKHHMISKRGGEIEYDIAIAKTIGHVFNSIRQKSPDLPEFYIEGALDQVVGSKLDEIYIPMLEKIYGLLLEIDKDEVDYNDLDNKVILIKQDDEQKKVMLFTDQNCQYLVIMEYKYGDSLSDLHVRRVWFEHGEFNPKWDDFANAEEKTKELAKDDRYHDVVEGNYYVRKPNLAWYEKKGFNLDYSNSINQKLEADKEFSYRSYGDSRDKGYVLSTGMSWGLLENSRVDAVIYSYGYIKSFFLDVQSALYILENEEY